MRKDVRQTRKNLKLGKSPKCLSIYENKKITGFQIFDVSPLTYIGFTELIPISGVNKKVNINGKKCVQISIVTKD